jgi:hypothetical protein
VIDQLTRRNFLQGTGGFVAGTLMRAGVPALATVSQAACTARDEGAAFQTITNDEAREIIAVAARILPTTDTPSFKRALPKPIRAPSDSQISMKWIRTHI